MQLKAQDLQLKAQKQQAEAAAKAQQLQLEAARIEAQKQIAAMQVGATAAAQKDKVHKQHMMDSTRLGVDIAKHRAEMAHNRTATILQNTMKNKQQGKPNKWRNL